jgi:hypothetical protein
MKGNMRVKAKTGIMLDLGGGNSKRPGFVSIDKRKLPTVDIVHDLEKIPYPLKDESVITMVASHLVEHLKPWLMIDIFNEWWRIGKVECELAISMPYGYSSGFLQDPTHCNACNEATWQYFDPSFPLYKVYEPKPWKIKFGPVYQANGNMEVLLQKIKI